MKTKFLFYILFFTSLSSFAGEVIFSELKRFTITGNTQGTTYGIIYYADNQKVSQKSIDSVLNVIDLSMSLYRDDSLISQFNLIDNERVKLDEHMQRVLRQSFEIYQHSNGLFDVTVKPLVDLWGFGAHKVIENLPDSNQVLQALHAVGMDKLHMESGYLSKLQKDITIDLNGIAQGYSVDVLADFLIQSDVQNFLVEVGGEIRVKGNKGNDELFSIALGQPIEDNQIQQRIVTIKEGAITTAGSYARYDGNLENRVSQHINPKTGYPVNSTVVTVTVISPEAMISDGWDNVFMAMKPKEAVKLADELKDLEIYMVYWDNGNLKEAYSAGFKKYLNN